MTIYGSSPLNYPTNTQTPFRVVANPRAPTTNDYKNFREGDEWLDTASNDWWKLAQLNGPSALWVKLGGTGAQVESFIPDSGTSPVVPNASNQITMTGGDNVEVVGSLNTLAFETKSGGYPITRFVVGPAGQAGYQTIASAITAAALAGSRSVYIMPGTYTENLTLVNGVNLIGTGFNICNIIGQHTPPASGTFLAQNLTFTTATDVFATGSAGTCAITCDDCMFNISNGYVFDLQLWSGALSLLRCSSIGAQDGVVNNTSGATVTITDCNLGAGTNNAMVLGGAVNFNGSTISCVTICNANTILTIDDCQFFNRISLLSNTVATISNSRINSGVLACILQSSSGAATLSNLSLNSSNVNALDGAGAGAVQLNNVSFLNSTGIASTLTLTGGTCVSGSFKTVNASTGLTIVDNNINATGSLSNIDIDLIAKGTGSINVNNQYKLPALDGSANYVMTTNGSGLASWQPNSSGPPSGAGFVWAMGYCNSAGTAYGITNATITPVSTGVCTITLTNSPPSTNWQPTATISGKSSATLVACEDINNVAYTFNIETTNADGTAFGNEDFFFSVSMFT